MSMPDPCTGAIRGCSSTSSHQQICRQPAQTALQMLTFLLAGRPAAAALRCVCSLCSQAEVTHS